MIELESPRSILLPRQMYADELPVMNVSEYINHNRITNPAGLKSTFKQGLGSLIWLRQTRQDIGFAITQIATQIAEACDSADKAAQLDNLYNKIVKFVKNHQRKSVTVDCLRPTTIRLEDHQPYWVGNYLSSQIRDSEL